MRRAWDEDKRQRGREWKESLQSYMPLLRQIPCWATKSIRKGQTSCTSKISIFSKLWRDFCMGQPCTGMQSIILREPLVSFYSKGALRNRNVVFITKWLNNIYIYISPKFPPHDGTLGCYTWCTLVPEVFFCCEETRQERNRSGERNLW